MDVERKTDIKLSFADLRIGATFLWDNQVFIKTEETRRGNNAMNLSLDLPSCFCLDAHVKRATFKLVEV